MPERQSLAVGVGNISRPCDDEDSVTAMRGTDIGSADTVPFSIVPARGQVSEYSIKSAASQGGDVFHEDVSWSNFANEPCEFLPQARLLAFDACAVSVVGYVLTGESSTQNIGPDSVVFEEVLIDFRDIVISPDMRPVSFQDGIAVFVDFAESYGPESTSPLKAERKPADTAE